MKTAIVLEGGGLRGAYTAVFVLGLLRIILNLISILEYHQVLCMRLVWQ